MSLSLLRCTRTQITNKISRCSTLRKRLHLICCHSHSAPYPASLLFPRAVNNTKQISYHSHRVTVPHRMTRETWDKVAIFIIRGAPFLKNGEFDSLASEISHPYPALTGIPQRSGVSCFVFSQLRILYIIPKYKSHCRITCHRQSIHHFIHDKLPMYQTRNQHPGSCG